MISDLDWLNSDRFQNVMSAVMQVINIIRYVIPIILVAMTTIDVTKKVINPNEKDGQQKLIIRLVGALLVFLSPIFINFILNFMGIDTSKLGGFTTTFRSKDITPVVTLKPDPVELNTFSLFSCPSSLRIGEKVELRTNIPSNYNGNIWWDQDGNSLDIKLSNDKRTATVEVVKDDGNLYPTVTAHAGDLTQTCTFIINPGFSIENCPSSDKVYAPGEKITIKTDVNEKYKGRIYWDQAERVFNITPIDDGKSVTLEVVDNPPTLLTKVTAKKGNKENSCYIRVSKPRLDTLNIINCPGSSNIRFDPGEEITLTTDIPESFKGDITWKKDLDDATTDITLTPSADGRSATIRVNENPSTTFVTPIVLAGGETKACTIFFFKSMQVDINN